MAYLEDWNTYAETHSACASDKNKMLLSRETLEGIEITGK